MKYFTLILLSLLSASAQIATQTVNEPIFLYNGGANRVTPQGFSQYYKNEFLWHLHNPGGEQTLVYNVADDTVASQFTEPGGFGSAFVAQGWSVQGDCSDVIVAVIDDSFDLSHPDLAGRWWINPATGVPGIRISSGVQSTNVNVSDAQYHGTMAAGLVGAIGNNARGVAGVCKDGVKIMPVACAGSSQDLTYGVGFAASNGAHIILFAYGSIYQKFDVGSGDVGSWTNAFVRAQELGSLIVAATAEYSPTQALALRFPALSLLDYPSMWSSNYTGSSTSGSPFYLERANDVLITNMLVVSGMRRDDVRYSLNSWSSQYVHAMYPSRAIPSLLPPSTNAYFNGTSPASAIAAGHAALLKQRYWNESMYQIKERILATVDVKTNYASECTSSGSANVYRSLIWQRTNAPAMVKRLRIF